MTDLFPVRRALISVSDKTGLVELAHVLAAGGIELLSTGGSAKTLRDAGLEVRDVAEVTGFPEMMDGRVKTLHPNVHGGLLALRDNADHVAAMQAHGIGGIDLLIVNLYPFEETVAAGGDYATCVENIDIGGPAMIRAAAKNHGFVTTVVDVQDMMRFWPSWPRKRGKHPMRFAKQWRNGPMRIRPDMTPPFLLGWRRLWENRHQAATAYRAVWRKGCVMVKTRINRPAFTWMAAAGRALQAQSSIKGKNYPIIILMTRMRLSNW
jgi:hypothetical protein